MRSSAVLTVCLLLVLAGCNAFPGGGSGADETTTAADVTTATVTPTTTDTDGATPSDADLPPGLSLSGVTDASALGAAHEEALAGRSYTYDREVRVVAENGTQLGHWSQHVQVGPDRLRFNYTQTGVGVSVSGVTIEDNRVYTNGSVTLWNASAYAPDGYRREPGRGFAANTFNSEQLLGDVLNASETSVETVERDGWTWYRVRADAGSDTLTYRVPNGSVEVNATNVTATALVAPSGFVRTVTYEFDFTRGGVSGHRTLTVRYSAVGETEVEVPAWVADAKATIAARGTATAGNASEEKALADRFPPGLNETGVTDPWKLATAHAGVLRNTSYTVISNLTARDFDGRVRGRADSTTEVEHDPTRQYVRSNIGGASPRSVGLLRDDVAVWTTENGTWYAIERPNGTEYQRASDGLGPTFGSRTDRDALYVLFSALNTTVAETVSRNGTTLFRVTATGVRDPSVLANQVGTESVRNVSMTALVGENGLVREYHLRYAATFGENATRVERTVRYVGLGETEVEAPAWVAKAREETAENATAEG